MRKAGAMRHFSFLFCFLVVGCSSVSAWAQEAPGCTTPPPGPAWTCVNGHWLPPATPDPMPPAPPQVIAISVGETVSGTISIGVFELIYELTAESAGFLTAELIWQEGFLALYLEHIPGILTPTGRVATLPVEAGRLYRMRVLTSIPWDLFSDIPFVLTTFISPDPPPAPVPVLSCPTGQPAPSWICINGADWVPPDHPLAEPAIPMPALPTPPAPPVAGPLSCVTVQPASTWVCLNGNWLPPDHPLALATPPSPPPTPPPSAPSGGCATPDPFIGLPGLFGVCINGDWIPIGHPLARGGG